MKPLIGVIIGQNKARLASGTIININLNQPIGATIAIGLNFELITAKQLQESHDICLQNEVWDKEERFFSFSFPDL